MIIRFEYKFFSNSTICKSKFSEVDDFPFHELMNGSDMVFLEGNAIEIDSVYSHCT